MPSEISGAKWERRRAAAGARDHYRCACGARAVTVVMVDPSMRGTARRTLRNLSARCAAHDDGRGTGPIPAAPPPRPSVVAPSPERVAPSRRRDPEPACVCRNHLGKGKALYQGRGDALAAGARVSFRYGLVAEPYRCPTAPGWHVRTRRARPLAPPPRPM